MIWCGYDAKMRSGIEEFVTGMHASIERKARERGVTLSAQISEEQDQMYHLEKFVEDIAQTRRMAPQAMLRLRAFLGLICLARYVVGEESNPADDAAEFGEAMRRKSNEVTDLIYKFDRAYSALPSGTSHHSKLRGAADEVGLVEGL